MSTGEGFEGWLREISPEAFEDDAFIPDADLRWLRSAYDAVGRLSRSETMARMKQAWFDTAQVALPVVLNDVERVRGSRPDMELVWVTEGSLQIGHVYERGSWALPSDGLTATTVDEALVQVAAAVFDLLADAEMQVPLSCPKHEFGLHPKLHDDQAVWWCKPPGHIVARIGALGS